MRIAAPGHKIKRIALTPMIDVVFLLLAFFLLSSTFTKTTVRPLSLQGSDAQQRETPSPPVVVVLMGDGAITLDGQPVTRSELRDALTSALAAAPERPLTIEPQSGVSVQALVAVMDDARGAGAKSIQLLRRPETSGLPGRAE